MPTTLPRFVIAAPASGQGKTTIAVGLMAALKQRGHLVAPFKVGPDYIDPGYHALATGQPGRNLDPHLCGEELIAPLLLHGAAVSDHDRKRLADLAVVEGVMGLFDGKLGTNGFGSTAHVARLITAPIVMVISGGHSSRSLAAIAHGMANFDSRINVAAVIINNVSSEKLITEITSAMSDAGLPVLGFVPKSADVVVPSRHLGLIPAAEREQAEVAVRGAATVVANHVDLDQLLMLAATAPNLSEQPWSPEDQVSPVKGRPRIAVAGGRAFTFRYPETTELLQAAGCDVVTIDPMGDGELPDDISGLYLGGGFPQIYASELAANQQLRDQIRTKVTQGLPTVAECAGLLYLCQTLDDIAMAGVLALHPAMGSKLTLGYHTCIADQDSVITRAGETFRSHEFHKTMIENPIGWNAWQIDSRSEGIATKTMLASYQHIHWAGHPEMAQRFAKAAANYAATPPDLLSTELTPELGKDHRGAVTSVPTHVTDQFIPDLGHHGDQDIAEHLIDLAVNVRAASPPVWLRETLLAGADKWAHYPDATPAREALAALHGLSSDMVLPTAGAAEAFTLIAHAITGDRPAIIHPQFTEPEVAMLAAGRQLQHIYLHQTDGFVLTPTVLSTITDQTDLIFIGNPTNPTSVLHPSATLTRLRQPGRILIVDEAFMDTVPSQTESMINHDLTNVLILRSLTKTFSLAGIRAGYVVGDPRLIKLLAAHQTRWSVSTPAIDAMLACSTATAAAEVHQAALTGAAQRDYLVQALAAVNVSCVANPQACFVLLDTSMISSHSIRPDLADLGFAVRRGESFPGLGPTWIRLAVRDQQTSDAVAAALAHLLERNHS